MVLLDKSYNTIVILESRTLRDDRIPRQIAQIVNNPQIVQSGAGCYRSPEYSVSLQHDRRSEFFLILNFNQIT